MEGNQMNFNQPNPEGKAPEIFHKREEKKSKLPLVSVVLSGITLFLTIVILIVVLMSSFMRPSMGGMTRGQGLPQNLDSPSQQQEEQGRANRPGNSN